MSSDLKEYGSGYSAQNLKYMVKLVNEFTEDEICHQLGDQLIPWRNLVDILYRCPAKEEKNKSINMVCKGLSNPNKISICVTNS